MFKMKFEYDLISSINNLRTTASSFKISLFKSFIYNEKFNKSAGNDFINGINYFLRDWESYGKNIKESIHNLHPNIGIKAMLYDDVKKYVYAKCDYSSIIPYTDALLKLIKDNENKSSNDLIELIDDFTNSTMEKAFNRDEKSVAELVDNVIEDDTKGFDRNPITSSDIGKFNGAIWQFSVGCGWRFGFTKRIGSV